MKSNDRRSFLKAAGAGFAGLLSLRGLSAAVQETTSPYRRPKLKITDVRTAFVQGMHVRIYTDQGLIGEGEAVDAVSGGAPIVAGFRSFLVGQDPLNVEAIWERIRTAGIFGGAQGGQFVAALTAVEIALWDLTGKALGLPIYQLLGGKVRDRVRIYCDSGTDNRNDPQAKAFILQIIENGFTMAKIDIDAAGDPARFDRVNWTANNAEIDHMVDKVAFMRESLPKTIELAVDMHGRYDLGTAKRVAKELEPFKLAWLEEPVPPENIDAMCGRAPIDPYAHLLRREPVPSPRFPANCWKRARWTSSCPTFRNAAACWRPARSRTWRTPTYMPIAPHCQASPIGDHGFLPRHGGGSQRSWCWSGIGAIPPRAPKGGSSIVKEGDIIQKGYMTRAGSCLESASRWTMRPFGRWCGPAAPGLGREAAPRHQDS